METKTLLIKEPTDTLNIIFTYLNVIDKGILKQTNKFFNKQIVFNEKEIKKIKILKKDFSYEYKKIVNNHYNYNKSYNYYKFLKINIEEKEKELQIHQITKIINKYIIINSKTMKFELKVQTVIDIFRIISIHKKYLINYKEFHKMTLKKIKEIIKTIENDRFFKKKYLSILKKLNKRIKEYDYLLK